MKIRVQSVNFNADTSLIDFIQKKMDKLDQFHDKIIDGEVYLKLDNNRQKENKIAEIKVNIPGNELVVSKERKTFEEATDEASEVLKRQLKKDKQKFREITT